MTAPGARVVAQGVEYRGATTRTWSRWNTGAVTWEDTTTITTIGPGGMAYTSFLYIGAGRADAPPAHVVMVDTAPLERVNRATPTPGEGAG